MHLPSWDDCAWKEKKDRNALEHFVYEQEPAGVLASSEFRNSLSAAIDFVEEATVKLLNENARKETK